MKFLADDDRFGIVITPTEYRTPTEGRRFYRFQLVVDGVLLGDTEPCIIGSAMNRLGNLHTLNDRRLSSGLSNPTKLMELLQVDEELHDPASLSLAESLDNWLLYGYRYEENVVFMAREYQSPEIFGDVLAVAIDSFVYDSLFEMALIYWIQCDATL